MLFDERASGRLSSVGLALAGLLAHAQGPARAFSPAASPGSAPSTGLLPTGKLGHLTISRLLCGGNLFSGSAHSRELIYVSSLLTHYFTPEKIMDTLELCEKCGINATILRYDPQRGDVRFPGPGRRRHRAQPVSHGPALGASVAIVSGRRFHHPAKNEYPGEAHGHRDDSCSIDSPGVAHLHRCGRRLRR